MKVVVFKGDFKPDLFEIVDIESSTVILGANVVGVIPALEILLDGDSLSNEVVKRIKSRLG